MKRRRGGNWTVIFLCCTLAVPTVAWIMGLYGPGRPGPEQLKPALVTGAMLGVAHLFLRPVLRVLSAPIGCLTLGLFGAVIDVGLLYGCAAMVDGFEVPGLLYAVLTAFTINVLCAVAGGRR